MYHSHMIHKEIFITTAFDGQRRRCTRRPCAICGKLFVIPVSRKQDTCSAICRGQYRRTRIKQICPVCGKSFEIKPFQAKANKGVSCCSRNCRNLAQRLDSGINVHRPGTYGRAKGRTEAGRLRRAKLKDKPICASCGMSFSALLVLHHIDGDENNNSPINREWLCWSHHASRHLRKTLSGWVYNSKSLTPRDQLPEIERLMKSAINGDVVQ